MSLASTMRRWLERSSRRRKPAHRGRFVPDVQTLEARLVPDASYTFAGSALPAPVKKVPSIGATEQQSERTTAVAFRETDKSEKYEQLDEHVYSERW